MKMTKKQIIKSISFTAILAAIIAPLCIFVFKPVTIATAYSSFYKEEENSLDLLLVGNSTVMFDYIPALSYKDSGITSHVIGSQPSHPEVIKIALDEIGRTQKPQLVYVDLAGLTYQTKPQQEYFVRNYYDAMPDSEAKKELSKKYGYLQSPEEKEFELFPNHNNFRNYELWLGVAQDQNLLKGFYPSWGNVSINPCEIDPEAKPISLPKDGKEYLTEILEIAKRYPETKFVFGRMPRYLQSSNDQNLNTIEATYVLKSAIPTINEAGFDYVDFCEQVKDIGLDYTKHQRDLDHLNKDGAKIFTPYFINYLKNNYGLHSEEKTKKTQDNFDESYKYYEKYYN